MRLWVEIISNQQNSRKWKSASSWGCELKFSEPVRANTVQCQPPREAVSWNVGSPSTNLSDVVSLLVRLWVEISLPVTRWAGCTCQPPCEAVSWNLREMLWVLKLNCQPPREAVSWNKINPTDVNVAASQPPREAVSWNMNTIRSKLWMTVSLLVRLWVEISYDMFESPDRLRSASSWGCELKCTWVRIPVWGQASCEVAYSTRYNKDSPTSIGGEMNCKQENERQWWVERNRYPPLTWGKSQSACCWHIRLCEITDCELKQILL